MNDQGHKTGREAELSPEHIQQQIEKIKKGTPFIEIVGPCTPQHGILRLLEDQKEHFLQLYDFLVKEKKLIKFIPASGAATRMFKALIDFQSVQTHPAPISLQEFSKLACALPLRQYLKEAGKDLEALLEEKNYATILEFLLTEKGLNYSKLPKALVHFHLCDGKSGTALKRIWRNLLLLLLKKTGQF